MLGPRVTVSRNPCHRDEEGVPYQDTNAKGLGPYRLGLMQINADRNLRSMTRRHCQEVRLFQSRGCYGWIG